MASYKVQIVDQQQGLSFNARYERLDKASEAKVVTVAKAGNGKVVKESTFFGNQLLPAGSTQRKWVDEDGKEYAKSELTFYLDGEPVSEVSQTKVMNIEGYQDESLYTDKYAICAYYEVFPDDNGMKKDIDKNIAINSNLKGLRKLWEFLTEQGVVARGVFCPTSRGFVESDGYIRAVTIDNKWGLEIGQFKQVKEFQHLNDKLPDDTADQVAVPVVAKRVRKI